MLPLATNRSTAAQKGTMHNLTTFKALSGSARKAMLIKLTATPFGPLTQNERGDLWDIAIAAFSSESEAMKVLATTLKGMADAAPSAEAPATQPEEQKKDTPVDKESNVIKADFSKLEVAIAANGNKADLGRNFRDRHPECFAKAK